MPDPDSLIKYSQLAATLLSFILILGLTLKRKQKPDLAKLFAASISGASIPTGLVLVWAAFDPDALNKISNAYIYIALAGCAVLFLSVKTLVEKAAA